MLLIWARQQCQGYPGIYINDFTNSWRNGRAFLAILHRHKYIATQFFSLFFLINSICSISSPKSINIKEIYNKSNRENLAQAFDFAQKRYGIMQLIDPEGIHIDHHRFTKALFCFL